MEEELKDKKEEGNVVQEKSDSKKSEKSAKNDKLLKIGLVILGIFGVFILLGALVSPILINAINPAARISAGNLGAVKVSPKPTIAPTHAAVVPTTATKATVKYTISPTPVKSSTPILYIKSGAYHSGESMPEYRTVTIQNQSTGKAISGPARDDYLLYYDLEPGNYMITASEVPGFKIHSSYCNDCSVGLNTGSSSSFSGSNSIFITLTKDKTGGAYFSYEKL